LLVPALPESALSRADHEATLSYGALFKDPQFWRLAPLSGLSIGSAWALQGLWAAAWMADVAGFDRATLVTSLFVRSLALSAGALGLGAAISFLKRWGVGPAKILPGMVLLLMAGEFLLTARHLVPSMIPWCLVAFMSAGTVATYSITAAVFDRSTLGRGTVRSICFTSAVHSSCNWPWVSYYLAGNLRLPGTTQEKHIR